MKKWTLIVVLVLALGWATAAQAAYLVPRQLDDSLYPSYMAYRVEFMPSMVTIAKTDNGVWTLSMDRNPYDYAGSTRVAFYLSFGAADDPMANYYDNVQIHAGSFTLNGHWYTAKITLPEEAKLYGCTDLERCELSVLSSDVRNNASCWMKADYGLGTTIRGRISFNVDEELHNYETYYENGRWSNVITEYTDEKEIRYHYTQGQLTTMEGIFRYVKGEKQEHVGVHYSAQGAFLYITYDDPATGRKYYIENDGKGWYYISGGKVYAEKPRGAADPSQVTGFTFSPAIRGDEETPPFYPEEVGTDNPLGKLAIFRGDEVVDYTGFAPFDGAEFYFRHGVIADDLAGVKKVEGVWYALDHGRLMKEDLPPVPFEGGVFAFKNGTIDESVSGLVQFNGEWFAFSYGMYQPAADGAWMNPNDNQWYYMVNGQWISSYNGLVNFDGTRFYFEGGKLATWFTGVVTENGVEYHVQNGQVV